MSNDNSELLVSVIIPVYNVSSYLQEALDSVIHQTYCNLEILIIDDGSTDGSDKLCDMYCFDPRIKVIHQENQGLSCARNVGLDHATGDYIAFLDSDDAFHLTFIDKAINIMTAKRPDLVVCGYNEYKTDGKMGHSVGKSKGQVHVPLLDHGIYGRADALCALVDGHIDMSVYNKFYRRALWDQIRFPPGHNYEDIDTMYRIFNICDSVFILDESLYFHRKRSGSITETISPKNIQDRVIALSHVENYIASHIPDVFTKEQLWQYRQRCLNSIMVQYIHIKDTSISIEMKDQITRLSKEIGLQNMSLRTRMAYQMICFCPWLLKITISIYLPVRLLIWKVTGL